MDVSNWNEEQIFAGIVLAVIAFISCLVVFFGSWYTIDAGERGILTTFGNPNMVPKEEGLHFKLPLIQDVVVMDIKTQKYEADLTAASKDLQDVNTKIAINYHLVSAQVPVIYKEIGIDYAARIIQPLEQEINKAVTSQFTAEELITKREMVREKMKNNLKEKLAPRGIVVEEVSIINFKFSESFSRAIEEKVTAEQQALTQKNKLAQVEYEAQQRVAQATAEAEAIKIQASAIQAQGGKDYVALQAIAKWNGAMPQYMFGDAMPFVSVPLGAEQ